MGDGKDRRERVGDGKKKVESERREKRRKNGRRERGGR